MFGYVLARPVTVRASGGAKHVPAAAHFGQPTVRDVHIATFKETLHVRQALEAQYPGVPQTELIRTVPAPQLRQWRGYPSVLGRLARDGDEDIDAAVLPDQLAGIRGRYGARRQLRVVIHNGFGTNLGDSLIGQTAWRAVLAVLRSQWPEVRADVLLGWHERDALARLMRQTEAVDQVLAGGPTLHALSGYQALFDFSNLITLPRYGQMPAVDWYLWWMGLDPATVADDDKRNRLTLDPADRACIDSLLPPFSGRTVLFNPMASEPLRRMPKAPALRLCAALVADGQTRVVLDQSVPFDHPRVLDLSARIDSPGKLAALIARVDALVTPDTFLQHVADATGTPACTICTSVPPAFYRYYPFGRALTLPGAQDLPGWGQTKVDPDRWAAMAPGYAAAWERLDPEAVRQALDEAMATRRRAGARAVRLDPPAATAPSLARPDDHGLLRPAGEEPDARTHAVDAAIRERALPALGPGDLVVLAGAGAGELPLALARAVYPQGRLVAFEPRAQLHQILCANLVATGCRGVDTHAVWPVGPDSGLTTLPTLDAAHAHDPLALGNGPATAPVVRWPLDLLGLAHCRLLVIRAPVPAAAVLEGAARTLAGCRPRVLAGPLAPGPAEQVTSWLTSRGYGVEALPLAVPSGECLLWARPAGEA